MIQGIIIKFGSRVIDSNECLLILIATLGKEKLTLYEV